MCGMVSCTLLADSGCYSASLLSSDSSTRSMCQTPENTFPEVLTMAWLLGFAFALLLNKSQHTTKVARGVNGL